MSDARARGESSPEQRERHDDEEPEPTSKKPRHRAHGSCTQCRKRKLRCDRVLPCSSCTSRGEAHRCTWGGSGVPLQVNRVSDDTLELRNQVDRLRSLVESLSRYSSTAHPYQQQQDQQQSSSQQQSQHTQLSSSYPFGPPPSFDPFPPYNYYSHPFEPKYIAPPNDVVLAICQLTTSHLGVVSNLSSSSSPLLQETIAYVSDDITKKNDFQYLPSFPFPTSQVPSFQNLVGNVPTGSLAHNCISHYILACEWHYHFLHIPSFNDRIARHADTPLTELDPAFIAVFLSACGIGLAMMSDSHASSCGCPTGSSKTELVHRWLASANHALVLCNFLQQPSLDAIRALAMIAAFCACTGNGDSLKTGITATSLAALSLNTLSSQMSAASSIQSTASNPTAYATQNSSQLEQEDRRRLFWSIFLLDLRISSILGRKPIFSNLGSVDLNLPGNFDDADFDSNGTLKPDFYDSDPYRETVMTSIIFDVRMGILTKRFDEHLARTSHVDYDSYRRQDYEISKLIDTLPPYLRLEWDEANIIRVPPNISQLTMLRLFYVNATILLERLNIHRRFLVGSTPEGAESKVICLRCSRMILAVHRHPITSRFGFGLTVKAILAGVYLAVLLIQEPPSPELYRAIREEIHTSANVLEDSPLASSITIKGAKIMRFLLHKAQTQQQQREQQRESSAGTSSGMVIPSRSSPLPQQQHFQMRTHSLPISNDPVAIPAPVPDTSTNVPTAHSSDPSGAHHPNWQDASMSIPRNYESSDPKGKGTEVRKGLTTPPAMSSTGGISRPLAPPLQRSRSESYPEQGGSGSGSGSGGMATASASATGPGPGPGPDDRSPVYQQEHMQQQQQQPSTFQVHLHGNYPQRPPYVESFSFTSADPSAAAPANPSSSLIPPPSAPSATAVPGGSSTSMVPQFLPSQQQQQQQQQAVTSGSTLYSQASFQPPMYSMPPRIRPSDVSSPTFQAQLTQPPTTPHASHQHQQQSTPQHQTQQQPPSPPQNKQPAGDSLAQQTQQIYYDFPDRRYSSQGSDRQP